MAGPVPEEGQGQGRAPCVPSGPCPHPSPGAAGQQHREHCSGCCFSANWRSRRLSVYSDKQQRFRFVFLLLNLIMEHNAIKKKKIHHVNH